MLPFEVGFKAGVPVYEQVVFAVKKAIVSGLLQPGDEFPSVRVLSQELKINPNTAHKVVTHLIQERLLEVRPGIGTSVAKAPPCTREQRGSLLVDEIERLVVEAGKLRLELEEVVEAVRKQWKRLRKG
jgi:GntR family transcriptional regulator